MEEVVERMDADLAACEVLLEGSGAFLTGATPTQADCFLYGLLDHVRPAPCSPRHSFGWLLVIAYYDFTRSLPGITASSSCEAATSASWGSV